MNRKDREHFKKLLLEKREAILKELGFLEETSLSKTMRDAGGDLSSYAFHMPDMGTDAMEREKAFHLASREGRYLHHIHEALERIEKGTFGSCRSCGEAISRARLEAVPSATLCISCKTLEEQRERGL